MHNELAESAISGHYLSEYNNGVVIFKPNSAWRAVRNRANRRRYSRAVGAGLRVVGRREGFTNNIQVIRLTGLICFFSLF
jgi:hypothetical protein